MAKISKSKTGLKGISPKVTVEESELLIGNKTVIRGYHTQECRPLKLEQPIKCVRDDARLGFAYYFWIEEDFSHSWGQIKKWTSYDVYTANLNIEKSLNSVFNEKHYLFFRKMIREAIQQFRKKDMSVTLEMVNAFLAKNVWPVYDIKCIIYDDKPTNKPKANLIYSEIPDLYYNKRIQVAVFNIENINNFKLYLKNQKTT